MALLVQPGSGDRRAACDRRVEADPADSDAPLTALCPVPRPRVVNFLVLLRQMKTDEEDA